MRADQARALDRAAVGVDRRPRAEHRVTHGAGTTAEEKAIGVLAAVERDARVLELAVPLEPYAEDSRALSAARSGSFSSFFAQRS